MDSRKTKGSIDEMSLVKASSWKLYQHGSELAEAKVPYETSPRPSKYKREAIRKSESYKENENNLHVSPLLMTPMSIAHYDISLLDSYDIQRISKQLDFYMDSGRADYCKRIFDGCDKRCRGKVVDFTWEDGRIVGKKLKEKKQFKGFWVVACGSRNDVIESKRSSVAGSSRWSEKQGMVVKADR